MNNSDTSDGERTGIGSVTYIDPNSQNHVDYFDHLEAFNAGSQRRISSRLNDVLGSNMENIAIATTGSDARLEKGPVSLAELTLFVRDHGNIERVHPILRDFVFNGSDKEYFEGVELKDLDRDKMYKFFTEYGNPNSSVLVSPNRIFDARILAGDQRVLDFAGQKLVAELTGEEGQSISGAVRDRLRQHRRTTVSGLQRYKQQDVKHFDLESGISFYDPTNNLHSFKQGPLRAVQYALVADLISGLRAGTLNPNAVLTLPQNTVDKLHAIEVEGLSALSPTASRDLADSYKFFLHLYHKAQHAYSRRGVKETGFDSRDVAERCKSLRDICAKSIVKY